MQQGLKSSYIDNLYVDSANFVWVCTTNSLEVFDGYRFEDISFTDKKSGKQLFNKVSSVRQIDKTHYWIQSNIGLFVYDLEDNSYEKVQLSETEEDLVNKGSLNHSVPYPGGKKTLFSSEGFGLFVIENATHQVDSVLSMKLNGLVGESYIWNILIDKKKRLWVSDLRNEITVINLSNDQKLQLEVSESARKIMSNSYVTSFCEDNKNNKIYMSMSHNGVLVFDGKSNTIRE